MSHDDRPSDVFTFYTSDAGINELNVSINDSTSKVQVGLKISNHIVNVNVGTNRYCSVTSSGLKSWVQIIIVSIILNYKLITVDYVILSFETDNPHIIFLTPSISIICSTQDFIIST